MKKLEGPEADYIKTSVRLSSDRREEVRLAARTAGHSMNDELAARINAKPFHERLDALERDIALIKAVVIELRDR
jgi:hypothetical protein